MSSKIDVISLRMETWPKMNRRSLSECELGSRGCHWVSRENAFPCRECRNVIIIVPILRLCLALHEATVVYYKRQCPTSSVHHHTLFDEHEGHTNEIITCSNACII